MHSSRQGSLPYGTARARSVCLHTLFRYCPNVPVYTYASVFNLFWAECFSVIYTGIHSLIVILNQLPKRIFYYNRGVYSDLGDTFLENLQGLTTSKIYRADERKAAEMDVEASHFRKITMRVLTMQLFSTTVMDILAYGGAAYGNYDFP